MPRIKPGPPCVVCKEPSVARNLCATHYQRWARHGHVDPTRPPDWGAREKHPLHHSWCWTARREAGGRVPEWGDFWQFVRDVGDRPSVNHALKRRDFDKPFGPSNCYWKERKPSADRAAYARQWRKDNPNKSKALWLKRKGLTVQQYDALLEQQNGACAICGRSERAVMKTARFKSLAIDHCHKGGKIRGLLCSHCNRGLGMFGDSPKLLKAAIRYLAK